MRTIQLLGLILSIVSFGVMIWALAPLTPESSAASESASGLVLMFIVVPSLAFSACLIIPSSIALLNPKLRYQTYFTGKLWYGVWGVNSLLSLSYVLVVLYIGFVYLTSSIGN